MCIRDRTGWLLVPAFPPSRFAPSVFAFLSSEVSLLSQSIFPCLGLQLSQLSITILTLLAVSLSLNCFIGFVIMTNKVVPFSLFELLHWFYHHDQSSDSLLSEWDMSTRHQTASLTVHFITSIHLFFCSKNNHQAPLTPLFSLLVEDSKNSSFSWIL